MLNKIISSILYLVLVCITLPIVGFGAIYGLICSRFKDGVYLNQQMRDNYQHNISGN
jgi:hypothetical protein